MIGSTAELTSLLLATGAFVVAVLTLYVGNLKRADIELICPSIRRLQMPEQKRRPEGPPESGELWIPLAVVNSGARVGLLTDLDLEGAGDRFFEVNGCTPRPNFRDGDPGVLPLVGGQTTTLYAIVNIRFTDESVNAWKQGSFDRFGLIFRYSYLRGRRIRPTATRRLKVSVEVEDLVAKP